MGDDYFRIPKSLAVFMTKEPRAKTEKNQTAEQSSDNEIDKMKSLLTVKSETSDDLQMKRVSVINSPVPDEYSSEDDKPLAQRLRESKAVPSKSSPSKIKKKSYSCPICLVSFDRKSRLTSHMIRHNNSRPHRCDICSKDFKTHTYMMRHKRIHSEPKNVYRCGICNFRARYKPYLKVHYIRRHTDEYQFSCEHCGKMFKLKSDHTLHMKGHEIESCVCDICGSSHPNKNSLYHHRQYRHSTNKKAYQCKTCKKRFSTLANLRSHIKLHDMIYVCEQCGMKFKRKYGLTKHMRTHSSEKKCLCAVCGKTFKSLSAQKVHLLTHVGERPYVCDICGKSFTQRSPMMLHRRTKHPEIADAPPPIKITNLLHGVKDKMITNNVSN